MAPPRPRSKPCSSGSPCCGRSRRSSGTTPGAPGWVGCASRTRCWCTTPPRRSSCSSSTASGRLGRTSSRERCTCAPASPTVHRRRSWPTRCSATSRRPASTRRWSCGRSPPRTTASGTNWSNAPSASHLRRCNPPSRRRPAISRRSAFEDVTTTLKPRCRARSAMARSALLSMVLLVALLAGCAGSSDPDGADPGGPMDGEGGTGAEPVTLDATSSVPAPTWAVGQWWEWEVFFADGTREDTFCSIVVSQSGGTSLLATEKDWASKEEAAFDQPLLGPASAADLSTEGWGGSLRLLSFPLTDGKTWTATMPNIAWDVLLPSETAEIAMTARFDDDLQGFRITGIAGGGTILEATYIPSTGWFGELVFHDVDPGQEGIEVGFRAKSTGLNYTGPY